MMWRRIRTYFQFLCPYFREPGLRLLQIELCPLEEICWRPNLPYLRMRPNQVRTRSLVWSLIHIPDIFIKRGNLDIEEDHGGGQPYEEMGENAMWLWRQWQNCCYKTKDICGYQKLEEATEDPSLQVSAGAWPCQYLDLTPVASRPVRQYLSVLSCLACHTVKSSLNVT